MCILIQRKDFIFPTFHKYCLSNKNVKFLEVALPAGLDFQVIQTELLPERLSSFQ